VNSPPNLSTGERRRLQAKLDRKEPDDYVSITHRELAALIDLPPEMRHLDFGKLD